MTLRDEVTRTTAAARPATRRGFGLAARLLGAVLAVTISLVHISDQGGLTALKDPAYVGYGYYLLEFGGLVVAALLLFAPAHRQVASWALAVGVAVGPLVGFVLSRGPGLPNYTDDRGNWTEPVALFAIAAEILLLVLTASVLSRGSQTRRIQTP